MQDKIGKEIKKISRLLHVSRNRENIDWSNPKNRKQRWVDKNIRFIMKLIPSFPLFKFMEHYDKGSKNAKKYMEFIAKARLRKEKGEKEKMDSEK